MDNNTSANSELNSNAGGEDVSRFTAEDRSKANALLGTLANLRTKENTLDEQIKDKVREAKVQMDRRERTENLRAETLDMQQKTSEWTQYIESAREVVNSFPGDTQILRLERKLESLQNEMRDADRTLKQRRTGVEAYQAKIRALQVSRETMLSDMSSLIKDMEEQARSELEVHQSVGNISTQQGMNTLTDVCNDREKELDALNKKLQEKFTRDRELTAQLQHLQETVQETIPRVENDKDHDIEEILGEWENEKSHLLAIYGKLCVINREQNYHLMRGTHIKRAPAKVSDINENRLNLNNTELAREVNSLKEKTQLNESDVRALITELGHVKKGNEKQRKEFQSVKAESEDRVKTTIEGRRELQIENQELQKLKVELMGLLQGLRENHTAMQRAALGNPPQSSVSPQRAIDFRRTD